MDQDDVFFAEEGDAWFLRNRQHIEGASGADWPLRLIEQLEQRTAIRDVAELGCANGWRLHVLSRQFPGRIVGVDASEEAIRAGQRDYPHLELRRGLLQRLPVEGEFDLVIVNFVLHWVDRRNLAASVAEVDRTVKDGGILLVGDFLPDSPHRRCYHHRPGEELYTFKQNYAQIFVALGTYRELSRVTYDHDRPERPSQSCSTDSRAVCVTLQKSLMGFYRTLP